MKRIPIPSWPNDNRDSKIAACILFANGNIDRKKFLWVLANIDSQKEKMLSIAGSGSLLFFDGLLPEIIIQIAKVKTNGSFEPNVLLEWALITAFGSKKFALAEIKSLLTSNIEWGGLSRAERLGFSVRELEMEQDNGYDNAFDMDLVSDRNARRISDEIDSIIENQVNPLTWEDVFGETDMFGNPEPRECMFKAVRRKTLGSPKR